MTRKFVNELGDGEAVDQVFLASEKQLRPNRAGKLYLQLRLSDKTGSITAMMWNANQQHYDGFENGDYVEVKGASQFYNGGMQVLAKSVKKSTANDIDEDDFVTLSAVAVNKMVARVAELLLSLIHI